MCTLPEYFLCLEVWGGVLPLGGEPTVNTTCAGLQEPGARPPPPQGGTRVQKRAKGVRGECWEIICIWSSKVPFHAKYQVHTFILGAYYNMFTCSYIKKHFFLILSITAVPLFTLCLNSQFRGLSLGAHPRTKNSICSDWLALTGLSKHRPCVTAVVFATMAMLRTWQRAVTVYLWHHNLTEVLAALLKIQFVVCRLCAILQFIKSNFIAPRPATTIRDLYVGLSFVGMSYIHTPKSKTTYICSSTDVPTCYVYGFFRGQVLCAASFTGRSAWSKSSHQQHVRQTTSTLRPAAKREETEAQRRGHERKEKCSE